MISTKSQGKSLLMGYTIAKWTRSGKQNHGFSGSQNLFSKY
jgi:hypothetical protein